MLNVGDLKPAELDIEFFLKLAWNPHSWNGTNTCDLLAKQLARDFGPASAPELTSILAEYYRLNFQRKPEHMGFQTNQLFSGNEAGQRLEAWRKVSARVDAVEKNLPPEMHDAFFELVGYPVKVAAAVNEKYLTGSPSAANEIHRLTDIYNHQTAGGKWRHMMSENPRGQVELGIPKISPVSGPVAANERPAGRTEFGNPNFPGANFAEDNHRVIIEADHASAFVPGKDAGWRKITGLGYNGGAVSVFPVTVAVRSQPQSILSESPCLQYKIWFQTAGDWKFTLRALPTFSVETGQPQRYAIALDDEPLQIISLPASLDEHNRQWQENVLRNAALTASLHAVSQPGLHTLKIWMVDPGIVLDAIAAEHGGDPNLGYVWPAETAVSPAK
jgi:hypothetical protein